MLCRLLSPSDNHSVNCLELDNNIYPLDIKIVLKTQKLVEIAGGIGERRKNEKRNNDEIINHTMVGNFIRNVMDCK